MSCGVQALLGKVARERGPVLKRPDLPMSQAHPSALGGGKATKLPMRIGVKSAKDVGHKPKKEW